MKEIPLEGIEFISLFYYGTVMSGYLEKPGYLAPGYLENVIQKKP